MFRFLFLIAIAIWSARGPAGETQSLPPAEAFAQPPQLAMADLSPDGRRIAFIFQSGGAEYIGSAPSRIEPNIRVNTLAVRDSEIVEWVQWANDDLVLFATSQPRITRTRAGRTLYSRRYLYAAPADLSSATPLWQEPEGRSGWRTPDPQFFDQVVDFLPEDPDHILQALNWREHETDDLVRTNVRTGEARIILEGRHGTRGYLTDLHGEPRLMWGQTDPDDFDSRFLMARPAGSPDWIDLSAHYEYGAFAPLGFGTDADLLLVASDHDADTMGLFEFNLSTGQMGRLLFRHPEVDITALVYNAARTRPVGVTYTLDEPQIHYFDPAFGRLRERLAAESGQSTVMVSSVSTGARAALLTATSADNPGALYLADTSSGESNLIGLFYPALENIALGEVSETRITARDGLELPAYVTLPPGSGANPGAEGLPFVILVHGGPAARDYRTFDYQAQFLASRGYGVLQINYRGSAGLGRSLYEAGQGQWGRGMQDDIDDAARWLSESGLADADRIAVMGGSYGGYAALMAAARDNGLYAAAISINGVTDLEGMMEQARGFVGLEARLRRMLDGVDLELMSPVTRAGSIDIPVLAFHSEWDSIVPISQYEALERALRRARVDRELHELPFDTHNIDRFQNRLLMLREIEAFLAEHMPSDSLRNRRR